jgi:hypothetical protein
VGEKGYELDNASPCLLSINKGERYLWPSSTSLALATKSNGADWWQGACKRYLEQHEEASNIFQGKKQAERPLRQVLSGTAEWN